MMISPPSARAVRIVKNALLCCPLLGIILPIFTIVVLIEHGTAPEGRHKRMVSSRQTHGDIDRGQEWAERLGVCEHIPQEFVFNTTLYSNNSIINLTVTLPSDKRIVVNASILSICNDLKTKQEYYFTPRAAKVNPFNHSFLINSQGLCAEYTEMLVLVHSLHDYVARRQAIRETWGAAIKHSAWPSIWNSNDYNSLLSKVEIGFVFGLHKNKSRDASLRIEADKYGDIIQGDFYEDYHNMTLKSLLALKWTSLFCPQIKYLVKSDDDMIINIPYLANTLTNITGGFRWSILGPLNVGSKALKRGKWSIQHKEYPFYYYPPYESGSAYVFSGDLIQPLLSLSEYVPQIFIDDVYITGILGKILNVCHKTSPGFAYWISKKPKPCDIINNVIVTGTRLKPADLITLWRHLSDQETLQKCTKLVVSK